MFFLFIFSSGKTFIKDNKKLFIIIFLVIILIISLFVIPNPLNKSGTIIYKIKSRISVSQLSQSFSVGSRITNWKFTTLMIKDNPLFGSGIGTYKYNSLRYQAKFLEQGQNRSIYPYVFATKTHNEYLQLWAELGIVGLGIFIWLIASYFNYGLRFIKRVENRHKQGIIIGLMGAVVAVLIDGIFGFPLHLPATIILFWLSIGLTVVIGRNELSSDKESIIQKYDNKKRKENWDEKDNQTNKANKAEELETNKTKLFLFKAFLYLGIILLSVFFMAMLK
jgi:O-antigen ligase